MRRPCSRVTVAIMPKSSHPWSESRGSGQSRSSALRTSGHGVQARRGLEYRAHFGRWCDAQSSICVHDGEPPHGTTTQPASRGLFRSRFPPLLSRSLPRCSVATQGLWGAVPRCPGTFRARPVQRRSAPPRHAAIRRCHPPRPRAASREPTTSSLAARSRYRRSMRDVGQWLDALDRGQYTDAFEENAIDADVLGELDHDVLKDVGVVAAGHRLRILKAARARRGCRENGATRARPCTGSRTGADRGRAPSPDGDVLRPGRLDRALPVPRSGGTARGDARLPGPLRRRHLAQPGSPLDSTASRPRAPRRPRSSL